jgi:hypothetical protein
MSLEALLRADFRHFPYDHQLREFETYCDAPARAKAWHMRTGKTKGVIDKACHLYRAGRVDGLLVFAPNGVHANWGEVELPKHVWPSVPWSALVWRTADAGTAAINGLPKAAVDDWVAANDSWWARLKAAKTTPGLMALCINSESMIRADVRKAVARFIKARKVFLVVDESDDFGTPGSKRTKMVRALARRCPYREILSGTLADASPLALWSQFEILEKAALGFETFGDFEDEYAEKETRRLGSRNIEKVVGYKNLDDLQARLAPYMSIVLRSDVQDMPDVNPRDRLIKPSAKQIEVFEAIRESYLVEIEEWESFSIGERADRLRKLQQVFSGFVFDDAGAPRIIPGPNPRLDALAAEAHKAPGKIIVWAAYRPEYKMIVDRLKRCKIPVFEYHGGVSDKAKAESLQAFRKIKGKAAFVGHVKSAGRGLDFSVAASMFFYSHTFSARLRKQAMERATAIGGKNIEAVDFLAPGPDRYIMQVVNDRFEVADFLTGVGMKEFLTGVQL